MELFLGRIRSTYFKMVRVSFYVASIAVYLTGTCSWSVVKAGKKGPKLGSHGTMCQAYWLSLLNTHFPASPFPFGPGDGSAPELSSLECTRSHARLGDIISSTENDERSSKGTEPQLFLLFSLRVLSLREEHS